MWFSVCTVFVCTYDDIRHYNKSKSKRTVQYIILLLHAKFTTPLFPNFLIKTSSTYFIPARSAWAPFSDCLQSVFSLHYTITFG